jgi:hypothetical protein
MGKHNLVPFIVLVGLIGILSMWKCYYGRYDLLDGFEDAVPEYCGTGGQKPSNGLVNLFKQRGANVDDITKSRFYSPSDCNKLENGEYSNKLFGTCTNKVTKLSYTEKCGGLNTVVSNVPSECMIDNTVLGKPIVGFTITMDEKQMIIDNNTAQLYNKNECDKLKGSFIPITNFKDNSSTEAEITKMIEVNGKDYGICVNNSIFFSIACVSETPPSAGSKIKDAVKSGIKDFLGI